MTNTQELPRFYIYFSEESNNLEIVKTTQTDSFFSV